MAGCGGGGGGGSAVSPYAGWITFVSNRNNSSALEVFVMDASGGHQQRVFAAGGANPGCCVFPVWSPDFRKIAFSDFSFSSGQPTNIYVVNPDGSGLKALTSNMNTCACPAWSPDGKKIAFVSNSGGAVNIWIINSGDGGGAANLTMGGYSNCYYPSWSPDGAKIVFMAAQSSKSQLFIIDVNTKTVTKLIDDTGHNYQYPAWSPDGGKIAFCSDRDSSGYYIYTINADGSGTPVKQTEVNSYFPHWSPDGNYLYFEYNNSGQYDVYRSRVIGSGDPMPEENLTNGAPGTFNGFYES